MISNDPKESVNIVTTHFNPGQHPLLKKVYDKWIPTMGELSKYLKAYEIIFNDNDSEINGSVKIQGTDKNLMWQKEALLNKAVQDTPDETEFFVWIDHDVVFKDPDWLSKAIEMLKTEEVDAVHCIDHATLLDEDDNVTKEKHWTPGYAWCSTTSYMKKRNGFSHYAIAGGGDSLWIQQRMDKLYQPMIEFRKTLAPRWKALDSGVYHLYHGTIKARKYWQRQRILARHQYQKDDVRLNEDGILEWASDKFEMHKEIKDFFQQRGG